MHKLPVLLLSIFLCVANALVAQEPAPAGTTQPGAPAGVETKSEPAPTGKKNKGLPPYVIIGTVFNEKALSYPNVRVQIRKAGEKKFRWDTYTNSRGEFAVRVPDGQEYELVVREKKYKEVSLKVDAKNGELQQRLSIRLEGLSQEKDGAKK